METPWASTTALLTSMDGCSARGLKIYWWWDAPRASLTALRTHWVQSSTRGANGVSEGIDDGPADTLVLMLCSMLDSCLPKEAPKVTLTALRICWAPGSVPSWVVRWPKEYMRVFLMAYPIRWVARWAGLVGGYSEGFEVGQ